MLSHYFEERRGGIEIVAAALARELGSRGFSIVWLAAAEGARNGDGARKLALSASNIAERLVKIPYPILLPAAWRTIFSEAARCDVILVHDALYMTSAIASLAARLHRKPLVVVQHVGFVPFRSALVRTLMRAANRCVAAPLLRRADRVIFISDITLRHFAAVRWIRSPALVFNGVDTGTFSPPVEAGGVESARRALELPPSVPIALFVGRFVEKKGPHVLSRLARARSDVLFAFAGLGELDPAHWGLPNVRVFTGLSGSTLATLYRASDVLVLPSAGEGFPLVVQEALACGLPVICGVDTARADPRAAAFLAGVSVDLANPDRTSALFSDALTQVLARPATQTERDNRFEFAKASYSWEASGSIYASILRGLRRR
jgi:glycosyltransferase involved in cell wall biosynthesis